MFQCNPVSSKEGEGLEHTIESGTVSHPLDLYCNNNYFLVVGIILHMNPVLIAVLTAYTSISQWDDKMNLLMH